MSKQNGYETAVRTCMGVEEGDRVVIVSDRKTDEIGKGLRKAALQITPQVRFFNLDIYGDRPLNRIPDGIEKAAKRADVTFWTGESHPGELKSVRKPFISAALNKGRHAHMVNINEKMIQTSMRADYEKIDEFTDELLDKVKNVDEIRVKNEQGTDLKASVPKFKWVKSTGICRTNGRWINLPSGELFKPPTTMEGEFVVDGVLGDYVGEMFMHEDLLETPVTVKVETKDKPRLVDVSCDNKEIEKEIENYVDQSDCASLVAELGMGTNIFLDDLVDNILQDEKFPGIHIAFGDPIPEETFADWSCSEHIDMVLTKCDVWFDDEQIMEKGEYIL